MGPKFKDRSEILFGRERDLAYLLDRSEQSGLTAVVGRAQMGKSWLLTELARQLSQGTNQTHNAFELLSLSARPPRLVGYTESAGETADLLLRAVVDLYSRWLSDSTFREQARVVYEQQKDDFIGKAGEAFGAILEKISKTAGPPGEAVGGSIKEILERLATANRELVSGRIQLPDLQIDQARDLLAMVHKITQYRVVLIFDQWEKSPEAKMESQVLDSFLRHLDDWPPCHILLGVQANEEKPHAVVKMELDFPGAAKVYPLEEMHLDENSSAALIEYVRNKTPAARNIPGTELLNLIAGYPRVVARWTDPIYARATIDSRALLEEAAKDAIAYRFPEFKQLLPNLTDGQRQLSMKLALLPSCGDTEGWKALKPIVMGGVPARDLDALKKEQVLEATSPPSFGHAKRAEAALQWLTENCYEELREVCEPLIFDISRQIHGATPSEAPYAGGLADLSPLTSTLGLSMSAHALCVAARSLFGSPHIDFEKLLGGATLLGAAHGESTHTLALGLFNALSEAAKEGKQDRTDTLLNELRQLAGTTYSQDPDLRELLAMGVFNALFHANPKGLLERRDALLQELRELATAYPQHTRLREWLGRAFLKTQEMPQRRDAMLSELRTVALANPQDPAAREKLAKALFNSIMYASEEHAWDREAALLEELRTVASSYPTDAAVREELAKGLAKTLSDTKLSDVSGRPHALLRQLRELAQTQPSDTNLYRCFATGLMCMLWLASRQGSLQDRDALLDDLRELARNHPNDTHLCRAFTVGLAMTAESEGNHPELRTSLIEELRNLADAHPQDEISRDIHKLLRELNESP